MWHWYSMMVSLQLPRFIDLLRNSGICMSVSYTHLDVYKRQYQYSSDEIVVNIQYLEDSQKQAYTKHLIQNMRKKNLGKSYEKEISYNIESD